MFIPVFAMGKNKSPKTNAQNVCCLVHALNPEVFTDTMQPKTIFLMFDGGIM